MSSTVQPRRMFAHNVVVLGDGGVGKTCICTQFALDHFVDSYDPTGGDEYRKQITVDGTSCIVSAMDTAGPDEYAALREQYIQHGEAFLLVFSITSKASFARIKSYYQSIQDIKKTSVPLILVGNKCDVACKDRQVSSQEAEGLAKEIGCTFVETSAKIPINIDETFYNLVRLQRKLIEEQRTTEATLTAPQTKGDEETKGDEVEKKGWKNRFSTFLRALKGKTV